MACSLIPRHALQEQGVELKPWQLRDLESHTKDGVLLCFTEEQSIAKLQSIVHAHEAAATRANPLRARSVKLPAGGRAPSSASAASTGMAPAQNAAPPAKESAATASAAPQSGHCKARSDRQQSRP